MAGNLLIYEKHEKKVNSIRAWADEMLEKLNCGINPNR